MELHRLDGRIEEKKITPVEAAKIYILRRVIQAIYHRIHEVGKEAWQEDKIACQLMAAKILIMNLVQQKVENEEEKLQKFYGDVREVMQTDDYDRIILKMKMQGPGNILCKEARDEAARLILAKRMQIREIRSSQRKQVKVLLNRLSHREKVMQLPCVPPMADVLKRFPRFYSKPRKNRWSSRASESSG